MYLYCINYIGGRHCYLYLMQIKIIKKFSIQYISII